MSNSKFMWKTAFSKLFSGSPIVDADAGRMNEKISQLNRDKKILEQAKIIATLYNLTSQGEGLVLLHLHVHGDTDYANDFAQLLIQSERGF